MHRYISGFPRLSAKGLKAKKMNGDITIRKIRKEDVEEIAVIERATFSEPWSAEDFLNEVDKEGHCYIAAFAEGKVAGYCGYWNVAGEGQIFNVAVREDLRGKGIGRALMTELLAEGEGEGIKAFTLEVRAGNAPAIGLYHSLGFEDAGIRRNFYTKPDEDAIIMWNMNLADVKECR